MPVNRYKGRYIVSGNHTDFPFWVFVSVAIHLVPAIVIVLFSRVSHRDFRQPVYQIELLTRPDTVKVEEAPKTEEMVHSEKPELKSEKKIKETKPEIIKKPQKEFITQKPKKKEFTARPDDAIAKMRERVAAEEAVEKIRKKVKAKETASREGKKIAAKAPAKVYYFEELDDEMKAYYATISQIIRNAWILPDVLRNKGYKTVIALKVLKDGTVQSIFIIQKSGNDYFDETAVRATNKIISLPPLPKIWKEEFIDLGFDFPKES